MTGAGRLFSDPQPVTAKAAPLCLPVSSVGNANAQNVRPRPSSKTRDGDSRYPPRRSFRQEWKPKGENPAQAGISAPADSPVLQGDGNKISQRLTRHLTGIVEGGLIKLLDFVTSSGVNWENSLPRARFDSRPLFCCENPSSLVRGRCAMRSCFRRPSGMN
ncbi:hypothetical protein J2R87_005848 [Bradyrhizobium elkanii]|jgi:hypothetical protein|nr:hypothetical protein [Bradyrhizobium elkanii]MCS3452366.1 hypothetical protein [Bradyrhizobium elkanii]MCS3565531.1 hypothetical protein [Bradyrhizobium elkanii]MCS4106382.1 hypothetical protein [Bradyrhizobium elkanii]MCW2356554.1 hypothetical protein [Bradyrhizobium elkanii]